MALSCGSVRNGGGRLTLARSKNACKLSLLPKGTLQDGPPAYILRIIIFRYFLADVKEIVFII